MLPLRALKAIPELIVKSSHARAAVDNRGTPVSSAECKKTRKPWTLPSSGLACVFYPSEKNMTWCEHALPVILTCTHTASPPESLEFLAGGLRDLTLWCRRIARGGIDWEKRHDISTRSVFQSQARCAPDKSRPTGPMWAVGFQLGNRYWDRLGSPYLRVIGDTFARTNDPVGRQRTPWTPLSSVECRPL